MRSIALCAVAGALVGRAVFAAILVACAPRPVHPAVAGYSAELAACVERSATRPAYDACAADVDARYRAIRDADRAAR